MKTISGFRKGDQVRYINHAEFIDETGVVTKVDGNWINVQVGKALSRYPANKLQKVPL